MDGKAVFSFLFSFYFLKALKSKKMEQTPKMEEHAHTDPSGMSWQRGGALLIFILVVLGQILVRRFLDWVCT
jgi:UDP-N-acetylmuramyl pentapeptide phosphotransferase/UDP-N-acetylglucosamine-1-phosphate transferase